MMEGLQKQGHALFYANVRQDDDISFTPLRQLVTEDDMHAMR